MTSYDFIEMKVPAKQEYVGVIRLTVSGIANRVGYTYDEVEDIKIAVAEALSNVVAHTYQEEQLMTVAFHVFLNRLEVVISDLGENNSLRQLKERLEPIDSRRPVKELKEGELGFLLIKSLMDKVEINEDDGVMLVLTKFLDQGGAQLADGTL